MPVSPGPEIKAATLLVIDDDAGAREGLRKLFDGAGQRKDAEVTIEAEDAWKIFTRGIRGEEAVRRAELSGDQRLGEKILQMVSVIA